MGYSSSDRRYSEEGISTNTSSDLKLYQAFIFSVPILFTFILLLLFYLFYLRRRRVDWSSLGMRTSSLQQQQDNLSTCELGLKKEVREMLPIIEYKASFSVKDPQCSVCLVDYEAEDKLQQIPGCGHVFHIECIDHWLTSHTTCPLCRQCLLASTKASTQSPNPLPIQTNTVTSSNETVVIQNCSQSSQGVSSSQQACDESLPQGCTREEGTDSHSRNVCTDPEVSNIKSDMVVCKISVV